MTSFLSSADNMQWTIDFEYAIFSRRDTELCGGYFAMGYIITSSAFS